MQIIVMAKEPRPGFAKTRLCPPCSPDQAARIAEAALADTLREVLRTPTDRRVVALDGDPGPWLPGGFDVIPQVDGPFGERLEAAIAETFSTGTGPVVLVGMDTPQLRSTHLEETAAMLGEGGDDRAVLGRAPDGGWWLLGLNQFVPGLFDGVEMSVESTANQQEQRLTELAYEVTTTTELRDMDHLDDARVIAAQVPGSPFAFTVSEVMAELDPPTPPEGQSRIAAS